MCKDCHVVTAKIKLKRDGAVVTACQVLRLQPPTQGRHRLYGDNLREGLGVQLEGWLYPTVFDTEHGEVYYDNYDNYGGSWGDPARLDEFLQRAAAEENKLIAQEQGYDLMSETVMPDGSIELVFDDHAEQYNQEYESQ